MYLKYNVIKKCSNFLILFLLNTKLMTADTLLKCQSECSYILITYPNKEAASSGAVCAGVCRRGALLVTNTY